MSNRRTAYYPVLVYASVLVLVWLASWLVSIMQMFSATAVKVHSIVSAEGVRWALLSMDDSLDSIPWGSLLLLMLVLGLSDGSGIARSLSRLVTGHRISGNEGRSLLFSVLVLSLYLAILFMFTISPWHTLLGVTGDIMHSPLAQGGLLLLLTGVLVVSLVFGFMYGNYRTLADVVVSAGGYMTIFVPALMAMIPAAGIVPCLEYSGFAAMIGLDEECADIAVELLCVFPFLYVAILWAMQKRER